MMAGSQIMNSQRSKKRRQQFFHNLDDKAHLSILTLTTDFKCRSTIPIITNHQCTFQIIFDITGAFQVFWSLRNNDHRFCYLRLKVAYF